MSQFRYGKYKCFPETDKTGEPNMQNLQTSNNQRRSEIRKKTSLTQVITWAFLIIGAIALIASFVYASSILSFIGLGLVFWGAIFTYIQTEQYTKKAVLEATVTSPVASLNQIIQELNYKGKATYLPPKYLKDPEASKIYISKQKNGKLPKPEITLKHENQIFLKKPQGILLTPSGAQLSRLFEKSLGTSFTKKDLKYLTQTMPKLLIEDLEIAEKIEIETENNKIKVRIDKTSLKEENKQTNESSDSYSSIHYPLSSAIACALTKATGKPVTIENNPLFKDGKMIETTYLILGKIEAETYWPKIKTDEHLIERIQQVRIRFLPNLASLLLTAIGSIILAQVAWITFYDMTVWGKDVTQIFMGSRTGQAISLGIGMTLIHFFILGLASFLSGIITFLLRRSKV